MRALHPEMRLRSYYWIVVRRAAEDAGTAVNRQGLLMGGAVGAVGGLLEWQLGAQPYVGSVVAAAALAVVFMAIVVFIGNLVAAPARLAREAAKNKAEAIEQRDEAERRLANRSSREQLADHLDECLREVGLLRREVPQDGEEVDEAVWWQTWLDFTTQVARQLRLHAPEWLSIWRETPPELIRPQGTDAATAHLDLSEAQLKQICAGLRAGTPPPTDSAQGRLSV